MSKFLLALPVLGLLALAAPSAHADEHYAGHPRFAGYYHHGYHRGYYHHRYYRWYHGRRYYYYNRGGPYYGPDGVAVHIRF